jgi:hypothetical protein
LGQNLADLAQFGVSRKIYLKEPELDHLLQDHLLLVSLQLRLEMEHQHLINNLWHEFVPSQNPELDEKTPPYEGSVL